MKPMLSLIGIVLLSIPVLPFLPWWAIYLFAIPIGFLDSGGWTSFGQGFLFGFLTWTLIAIWQAWGAIISPAEALGGLAGDLSPTFGYIITGLLAGLPCGFIALSIYFGKQLRNKKEAFLS